MNLMKPAVSLMKNLAGNDAEKIVDIDNTQLVKYMSKKVIPKYAGGSNQLDFTKPLTGSVSYKQGLPSYLNKQDFTQFLEATKNLRKAA